jgi:hypothetical protein
VNSKGQQSSFYEETLATKAPPVAPDDDPFRRCGKADNAHCGTLASLLSIRSSIEGIGSTIQGMELRRPGGKDAARLGKEMAR